MIPVHRSAIGPEVGRRLPELELPDQEGRRISLHDHRAGRKALVVFFRSADW
jgi:peroxiredoxin